MRIGGLASGMDIDSMVGELMKAQRMPLDKLNQKKQVLGWQRDQYRDINKKMADLDTYIFDKMALSNTYNKKKVTSSDESKVTARSINSTQNYSAKIQVDKLATSTTYKSGDITKFTQGDHALEFHVTDPGNSQANPDPVKINIASTDTLDDIVKKINGSELCVTAMKEKILDSSTGEYTETIAFTSVKTGKGGKIEAADDTTANFMSSSLGFSLNGRELNSLQLGENAKVKVNGFDMEKTSNQFAINGMEYTLLNTTSSELTISSETDTDGIYDTIKEFVDKYNGLIDEVNQKVNESRYRDYQPLTAEQKKEMSEDEIKLWEEKAKSGLLKNDSILTSGMNGMRMDFYSGVKSDGTTQQLTEFGISTSSVYQLRGHLEIDEDQLKQKIKEDPESLQQLFVGGGRNASYEEKGIAYRLRATMDTTMKQIENKAGNTTKSNNQFSIGKSLDDVDKQVNRFEDRMKQVEDRYWRQFSAMETAIQRMNEQSAYMSQQFGSLGG
ncbi:flagellar hook-associated protein 2 [Bacillus gobiensis]|uniref:flagellar hook-associated protein 2 n=1 Tax=Bacillus gobiensis TaxID=1441095 RepID=UPI003D1C41E2